jgi:hypothetical protein
MASGDPFEQLYGQPLAGGYTSARNGSSERDKRKPLPLFDPEERPIQGEKGEKGEPGTPGERGERGERGHAGRDGAPGPAGPRGEAGPAGPQGDQGPRGPHGIQGGLGPQGPQGIPGDRGPQGPQGVAGPQGERGERGVAGQRGPQGVRGQRGYRGMKGRDGRIVDAGPAVGVDLGYQHDGPVHTLPVHESPEAKAYARDERRSAARRIENRNRLANDQISRDYIQGHQSGPHPSVSDEQMPSVENRNPNLHSLQFNKLDPEKQYRM